MKHLCGMELAWPEEERPRQAGLSGFLCDRGGHKQMECAHLVPPFIDTYRIRDLYERGGYGPVGDFTCRPWRRIRY